MFVGCCLHVVMILWLCCVVEFDWLVGIYIGNSVGLVIYLLGVVWGFIVVVAIYATAFVAPDLFSFGVALLWNRISVSV